MWEGRGAARVLHCTALESFGQRLPLPRYRCMPAALLAIHTPAALFCPPTHANHALSPPLALQARRRRADAGLGLRRRRNGAGAAGIGTAMRAAGPLPCQPPASHCNCLPTNSSVMLTCREAITCAGSSGTSGLTATCAAAAATTPQPLSSARRRLQPPRRASTPAAVGRAAPTAPGTAPWLWAAASQRRRKSLGGWRGRRLWGAEGRGGWVRRDGQGGAGESAAGVGSNVIGHCWSATARCAVRASWAGGWAPREAGFQRQQSPVVSRAWPHAKRMSCRAPSPSPHPRSPPSSQT